MRAITRNDFRQLEEDGWRAHYAGLSIVTDAEAPRSAPYVAELRYPRGFVGGESPGLLERGLDGSPTTLYLSFWLKLSQNWVGHPTGTNKVLHLWLGGRNRVFVYADGAGSGILRAAIGVQGIVSNGGSANLLPNLSTAEVVRGRWHHWEIVVRANHTQRSDGEITWWLDGRPAGRYSGVAFTMRGEGFELMKWDPTWGGLGGRLGASQAMWMDEIFASGR